MRANLSVVMSGEDVGHLGGSFTVSLDLHKKHGDLRVLDTPICGTSVSSINYEPLCQSLYLVGSYGPI